MLEKSLNDAISNVNESHFFEGTEKLFEIWFSCDEPNSAKHLPDLQIISRAEWENLLKSVNCEIVSEKKSKDMVAYLLSESSLFVTENRFILKTCGKTTLLNAITPLLSLVKEKCGFSKIKDVYYSRLRFRRPELQPEIHRKFENELTILKDIFKGGSGYQLGPLDGDCWYFYTADSHGVSQPDQTLEVIMTQLDSDVMKLFVKENSQTSINSRKNSGIDLLLPGSTIDDFLFDPCGYSANGLLQNGDYFTIHITPEPEFSYVSFETNVSNISYKLLLEKIIKTFKPNVFLITLFANQESKELTTLNDIENWKQIYGFQRKDHHVCSTKNYKVAYAHFEKNVSVTEGHS